MSSTSFRVSAGIASSPPLVSPLIYPWRLRAASYHCARAWTHGALPRLRERLGLELRLAAEPAGELGAEPQVVVGDPAGAGDVALLERGDQLAVVLAHGVAGRREVGEQRHEAAH